MKKKTLSLLLFALMVVNMAIAGTITADNGCDKLSLTQKPLTLIELTDIALGCNPSTRAAWAQTKISLANLGTAYSTLWPQINGTADMQYTTNSNGATTGKAGKTELNYGPGVTLSYLLWDFGVRTQKIKAADFQLQAARFSQNATLQQIVLQVEQVYYQLIAGKSVMLANTASVKENKKNLETAKALRKQGMATIGDVYQAESALSQAILNLESSQGTLRILEGQLALAIGIPIQTPVKLEKLSDTIDTKFTFDSIDSLMSYAKETRTDFLAAEANVKAANAQLESTKWQAWPSIQLNTTSQWLRANNPSLNNRSNTAILSISIPIFDGFVQKYALTQATGQKEASEATRDLLGQQIEFQVWQAYYGLKTAGKSIESSRNFLAASEQAAKQAYGQYQEGVGSILTVLSTQATLETARFQLIQSKMNWYSALAQFSYSLGKMDV